MSKTFSGTDTPTAKSDIKSNSEVKGTIDKMPPHLLQLHEDGNMAKPLVTVDLDGTVTIHQKGKEEKAAEIFWNAVQTHLRLDPILQEIRNTMSLKERLCKSKKIMSRALNMFKTNLQNSNEDHPDMEAIFEAIALIETFPDYKIQA